jgi:hypothetical protein
MPTKMKVCNTKEYTRTLIERGQIFALFDEATKVWSAKKVKDCASSRYKYGERFIQILAVLRYTLKFPFRQLEGLLKDYVARTLEIKMEIPNFSTLCRRMQRMQVMIHDNRTAQEKQSGEPIEILIDSSGINIYHTV